jgi:hypothetical protein
MTLFRDALAGIAVNRGLASLEPLANQGVIGVWITGGTTVIRS